MLNWDLIGIITFFFYLGVGAHLDWKTGKVSNWLFLCCIAAGIMVSLVSINPFALFLGVTGYFIAYAIHMCGGLGGGDTLLFPGLIMLFPNPSFLLFTFLLAIGISVLASFFWKKKSMPFLPIVLAAATINLFWLL